MVIVAWPSGWLGMALQVALPAGLGLLVYGAVGAAFGVAEISDLVATLQRRLRRK